MNCEECGHPLAAHRGDGLCLHCGCEAGSVWKERDALQTKLERVEDALRKEAYGSQWCLVCHGAREVLEQK